MKGLAWSCGGLILLVCTAEAGAEGKSRISANDIMVRAVERTRHFKRLPDCQYFKRSTERELDSKGILDTQTDEIYHVVIRNGVPHSNLLEVNGRELSPEQARNLEKEEKAQERKLRGRRAELETARPQSLMTRDLVSRYIFTLIGMENFNGRAAYRLGFAPKQGLRMRDITDRFFNHIAGTVWIDAHDYELARAEIHLTRDFKLWGGILADVKRCDFTLDQTRLPDGTWLNRSVRGTFEARKLLVTSRTEIDSEATDFKVEPHTAAR